jgi:triacylglycerol lipase
MPLAAHHRVLALDQLGFGGSDKPFINYGIQTWVDFLGEFLRERKPGAFALVGESLGGWVAAQYSIQALGSGPAPGPSFALPKPARLVLADAAGHRALAKMMGKGDTWTIRSFSTNPAIQAEAVDDKLGGITIPTLVVWGAYDGAVPLEDGKDFAARIAGARLIVIPDCGHAPCIENPPAFLAAVQPFLDAGP